MARNPVNSITRTRSGLWSWGLVALTMAALVSLSVLAIPLLITFDGHWYLSGSKFLFGPDAAERFWWLREPGYSLWLRTGRWLFGDSDLWLTMAQSVVILLGGLFASFAAWMSLRPADRIGSTPRTYLCVSLLLGAGNACVLFYASAVLQQALMVFLLGSAVLLAVFLSRRPSAWSIGLTAVLLVCAAYLQEEFARLLGIPVGLGIAVYWARRSSPHLKRGGLIGVVAGVAAFAACQVLATVALVPWTSYRNTEIASISDPSRLPPSDFSSLKDQVMTSLAPTEPHPYSIGSHALAFVGLSGSSQFESRHLERVVYVLARQVPGRSCGSIEGMGEPYEYIVSGAHDTIEPYCRPVPFIAWSLPFTLASVVVYPILLVAGLVAGAWVVFRRREVIVSVSILAISAAYSLLGFGADRYSVPVFPVAVALLIALIWQAKFKSPTARNE